MLVTLALLIGFLWSNLKRVSSNQFKLLGYTITIDKPSRPISEVIPFKKKLVPIVEECDLCHGEDLYINKSIMMCPKCKRNKSRIKSI